jgi:hypothetical protein
MMNNLITSENMMITYWPYNDINCNNMKWLGWGEPFSFKNPIMIYINELHHLLD